MEQKQNGAALLDALIKRDGHKNDAALAAAMDINPGAISKMRHGKMSITPHFILRAYDQGFSISEIRTLLNSHV